MAITAASTSALALLDASTAPISVHSIYPSGVNLRCGDYLIHASTRPHGGACSLGMTARDVELLRRHPSWSWTAGTPVASGRRATMVAYGGQGTLVADGEQATIRTDKALQRYSTSPPPPPALSSATPGLLERARARTGARSWFDSATGRSLGLPSLRAAIRALVRPHTDAPSPVRGVVGLGTGLTPSADDALVGALCLLSAGDAVPDEVREDMSGWLRAGGAGSTTDVSQSYLRLAFDGVFSVPVNRVVGSLASGCSEAELAESVRALAELGASSGMDTALGIQIACEVLTAATNDHDPR